MSEGAPEQLSERELELLALVATGATNQQIARDLSISVNTVKAHLRNIFAKLGVESRTEATLIAIQQGLIHVASSEDDAAAPEAVADAPAARTPTPIQVPWTLRAGQRLALVLAFVLIVASAVWPAAPAGSATIDSRFVDLPRPEAVAQETTEASRWSTGAQMPIATGRFAQAVVNDVIYTMGGLTEQGWSADTNIYDPEGDRWTRGAPKPTAVANAGAAAVDGRIYVPGGLDAASVVRDILEVYDPATDAWSTLAPLPAPRCAYAIAPIEGGLLVIGGWDGARYVGTVYRYDVATDAWSEEAPLHTPRGHAAADVWDGKVFVVGGYDGSTEYGLCESFDIALAREGADPWRTHLPMRVGRTGHAVAAAEGILYVVGGDGGRADFYERYDIANDVWSTFDSPQSGPWQHLGLSAVTARGGVSLYAIGGWADRYLGSVRAYQTSFRVFLP